MSLDRILAGMLGSWMGLLSLQAVDGQEPSPHDEARSEVIQVSPPMDGQTASLQAAIDAAPEHAVVRIAPGTYEGPFRITKPLTLEGDGWGTTKLTNDWSELRGLLDGEISLDAARQRRFDEMVRRVKETDGEEYGRAMVALWDEFGGKPTLTVSNTGDVAVKGLTISMLGKVRAGGGQIDCMVLVKDAGVRFEDCAVAGSPVDGFHVVGASDLKIYKCLIAGVRWSGISVHPAQMPTSDGDDAASTPTARVRVTECDIRNCGYSGLVMRGPAEVEVARCRISKTAFHGIFYRDTSPMVSGNVFFDIARGGLYIAGQTHGTVRDNVFLGCSIWNHDHDDQHRDLFEYNTLVYPEREGDEQNHAAGNQQAAIWVEGHSLPTIRRNLVRGSDHGVMLDGTTEELPVLDSNIFDVRDAALMRWVEHGDEGRYEAIDLPAGNQTTSVRFADATAGNYALAEGQTLHDINVGTRGYAEIKSPWPEHPEETQLMRQLAEAESQQ